MGRWRETSGRDEAGQGWEEASRNKPNSDTGGDIQKHRGEQCTWQERGLQGQRRKKVGRVGESVKYVGRRADDHISVTVKGTILSV